MNKKHIYIIVVFLIVACMMAFGQIIDNDFVGYDDDRLITENGFIQDGINAKSIKWAFTDSYHEYWHPLTWLSLMLDWRLFGSNASGYHFVSLLLHIGAALFLFLFLNKATKSLWPSAFAAAFFALHPLRVESVAWAAERKDVLSMFFGMGTLYFYVYYAETRRISKYIVCLILFALSIMSKPMLVTLPCVLLLLDYWPLARWQKQLTPVNIPAMASKISDKNKMKKMNWNIPKEEKKTTPFKCRHPVMVNLLWEKVPFFLLSVLVGIMVIGQLHTSNRMASLHEINFSERIINALISYFSYLAKTFWPVDLAVFYPHELSFQLWTILGATSALLIITATVVYLVKKAPFLTVGWLWYLGTLFPVIGLMQTGYQAMADRYTYLPSIGIAIMLAWSVPSLIKKDDLRKNLLFPAAIAVLMIITVLTWEQCQHWKNDMTLSTHALRVTKNNYVAHNILAASLIREKKINEAIYHYNKSIRINPNYHFTYNNRGIVYRNLGQYKIAIGDFSRAIGLKKDFATAYINRGITYHSLGQYKLAIEDYNKAMDHRPYNAEVYNNRGGAYFNLGQYELAIKDYSKIIDLRQNFAGAYNNRAAAYLVQGKKELGCKDAQKACALGDCQTLNLARNKGDCR